jgi:hypothetical protein
VKVNIHRGSDFRDFLKEQGILEEVEERGMKTRRAAVDRLASSRLPSAWDDAY